MKASAKIFILISIITSCQYSICVGQDIHFSQFYMSPLTLNPALAGTNGDLQGIMIYREQWRSVTDPFRTFAASYDLKIHKTNSGYLSAGLNFFSDRAGDANMGSTNAGLSIAYHVYLNEEMSLGAGIQTAFTQRSVNPNALQWGSQYDGMAYNPGLSSNEPPLVSSFSYADLGTGLIWTYDKSRGAGVGGNEHFLINIGGGMLHLPQTTFSYFNPENPEEKLHIRYALHGNALISIKNTNVALAPGFMVFQQGPSRSFYAGSLVRYQLKQESKYTGFSQGAALSLGGYYRAMDAVALAMLLEYSHYAIGISYDLNVSGLRATTNMRGGFEISLRFVNPHPFTTSKARSRI